MSELVDKSPFRAADGTIYIGRKNTLMIEIDPRSGKILQQIDMDHYLMSTHSKYPPRTLFLGRNGKKKRQWF